MKICKFDLAYKSFEKGKKTLEILTKFPLSKLFEDIIKLGKKISIEFIKLGLIDGLFECYLNMNFFFYKKEYNNACKVYDDFLIKTKKSKFYKHIREKITVIEELHTEIQTEYYNVCIERGDLYHRNRKREAVKYYQIAKNLVKHLFENRGPLIVQLLKLIEESEQFY